MNKLVVIMVLFVALGVQAQEPTIADLQKQLQVLAAKIEKLEQQAAQKSSVAAVPPDVTARIEKLEERPTVPEWTTNMKIKGDFRYRYENISEDNSTESNRQRIRLRVGAYGQVNDYIDYGVRVATGGSSTSANQTLGDTQSGMFNLWLDRAYVDIHPDIFKGAHVVLGKMAQPWISRTGLIWDSDLNPEGIAVTISTNLENGVTLHANAGAFIIDDENLSGSDGGDDPRLWAGQLVMDTKVGDAKVQLGIADYWFENVDYYGLASANNTANSGFNIVEGIASVGTKVGDVPFKVYGQYAVNTEAENSDQDTAYLIGAKLGKAKSPGSWELGYNWRDIQHDAVVEGLNDGDFGGGQGAGAYGHSLSAKYQVSKNFQVGATYLMAVNGDGEDEDTVQVDANFKF